MRLAVLGSRGFEDYPKLEKILDIIVPQFKVNTIVSGGARGADSLAEKYATKSGLELDVYPADWDKHGKSAGYIRNVDIWNNSDMGIAFHDGQSKGTEHSFDLAKKQNKKLFIYNYVLDKIYLN